MQLHSFSKNFLGENSLKVRINMCILITFYIHRYWMVSDCTADALENIFSGKRILKNSQSLSINRIINVFIIITL